AAQSPGTLSSEPGGSGTQGSGRKSGLCDPGSFATSVKREKREGERREIEKRKGER
ncbi:unnamed protein product, partial [Staurois parvus]